MRGATARRRRIQIYLMCVGWAAAVAVAQVMKFGPLHRQELGLVDARFRLRGPRAPDPDVVVIGIDQRSLTADRFTAEELAANPALARLKAFPYPRTVYADLIEKLVSAGARVVAIDLLFLSPRDGDEVLRAAIARHADRVVLGSNFTDDGRQLLVPAVVVPEGVPVERVTGYVNFWPDVDGVVRRARYRTTAAEQAKVRPRAGEPVVESFAARAVGKVGPVGLIDFAGPAGTYRSVALAEVFYQKTWERNLQNGAVFRDKIVLVGPTGNFQQDQHPTPFGPKDGVEIHAETIATIRQGHAPVEMPAWFEVLVLVVLSVGVGMLLNATGHPMGKLVLLVVLGLAYGGVAHGAFVWANQVWPVAAPWWVVAGSGVGGLTLQFVAERLERLRIRRTLDRYVSREVAEEILRHSEEYEQTLGGQRRAVTILFSDVRDFTTISEQTDPVELVRQLNEYLGAMVDVVMRHGGTLDKFIGDAIMAVWGAPTSHGAPEDAWRAVQTAYEMRQRLAELQRRWELEGRTRLRIGIGLNHGEVVVGNIGSPQRMEYTVIGDPVNVASRVEGL
ncbi:MAG: adenylate/guanylate cyclase domain-containing protein, partial [Verrucomicrobiae bacterium]|nr:adenylate/guanylate cyclase domain-containing protein [Verrucomicrobiae bacterium]